MSCDKDCAKEPSRWMALDIGSKRIGVAISDLLRITARPLVTLERTDSAEDVHRIIELAEMHQVTHIVVGRPLNLSGKRGPIVDLVESFVGLLEKESELVIKWADERLSTKEAEALMGELGMDITQRRAKRDQYAAALILTWYLEEHSGGE